MVAAELLVQIKSDGFVLGFFSRMPAPERLERLLGLGKPVTRPSMSSSVRSPKMAV